ncbi:toxin [Photorhabdus laumondii]|uniref:toxin n=1 Tax=Photorhabdus laumondii TaxID=2218628 RepID=UPI003315901E
MCAARSVICIVENYSSKKLSLNQSSLNLSHGIWDSYPPTRINKSTNQGPGYAKWETESDGFMTGTQGRCAYQFYDDNIGDIFNIYISWDDPYIGNDSFGISTDSDVISVKYNSADGNNATVTYTIYDV